MCKDCNYETHNHKVNEATSLSIKEIVEELLHNTHFNNAIEFAHISKNAGVLRLYNGQEFILTLKRRK